MPKIYLSPSTQEFNPYYGGGNEEEYMNLVADAMVPCLIASGIKFTRNTPDMTAASSIRESNNGRYDLHLALHSNASGREGGGVSGAEFYYYPTSTRGQRAAEIMANNFKMIYPNPDKVKTIATRSLGEVSRTRAPSVLAEVAYHDDPQDADWIRNNVENIAKNLVLSLADYFDIPFNCFNPNVRISKVFTPGGGNLNVRERPDVNSPRIGSLPNGTEVKVYYDTGLWSLIESDNLTGYVNNNYLN